MNKKVWFILILLSSLASYLYAGTTGKIAGQVLDAGTNEPLPGVNVMLDAVWVDETEVTLSEKLGAATNFDGEFFINNIPPGSYTVRLSMIGYDTKAVKHLKVSIDFTAPLNISLNEKTLEIGKEVMVIAEKDIIRKDLTASTAVVDNKVIQQMPVEELNDVLELQAGLIKDAGGGLHVRGGKSGEVAYWVDGVPITDGYSGSIGQGIENNIVSELQLITGTFNAEYGQAMSGIVNIVTKSGGQLYKGQFSSYLGDYVSTRTNTFYNIDAFNPTYNIEGSLEGPIPLSAKKVTFFGNLRYYYDDGYRYGQNLFTPWRLNGDTKKVAMSNDDRISYMIKLSFNFIPNVNLSYQILGNKREYQLYDHYYKFTPQGNLNRFEDGITHIVSLTHTLSARTFYEFRYAHYYTHYEHYAFEDYLLGEMLQADDSRNTYAPTEFSDSPSSYSFSYGGNNLNRFERSTAYHVFKLDYTSQMNARHQLKAGLEARFYKLDYSNITLFSERKIYESQPGILDTAWVFNEPITESNLYSVYKKNPLSYSAYLQDKMEFKEIIFNLGLRFDYFDADGQIFTNSRYPNIYNPQKPEWALMTIDERKAFWYKNVDAKYQISPRIGIGYPISDKGTIHFSYGHFFQMPRFEYLYDNPEYKITRDTRSAGNPDLDAEKTISYEIGLQQQLASDVSLDLTAYYRDIRGWIAQSRRLIAEGIGSYTIMDNYDYASVRGIVVALKKHFSQSFTASLDYTFQVADGIDYDKSPTVTEPKVYMVPLGYDQRHTLNIFTGYQLKGYNLSLLGKYWSGQPYTPSFPYGISRGGSTLYSLPTNSTRKPTIFVLDFKFTKQFKLGKFSYMLFANVYNIMDSDGAINVYSDTGKPDKDTYYRVFENSTDFRVGTIEENLNNPNNYVEPRKIHAGVTVNF